VAAGSGVGTALSISSAVGDGKGTEHAVRYRPVTMVIKKYLLLIIQIPI
jgi:hypothetical protein